MNNQTAELEWRDGILPLSVRFDDPYFSVHDGLAETQHVFLAGNDLPDRFGGDFHIAELGFGTGLNFLAAWKCWEEAGGEGTLTFTTFEAYPMAVADMARALTAFPDVAHWADQLIAALQHGGVDHDFGPVRLRIILGDVRQTLPAADLVANAWFLDGFAPIKNPEMWTIDVLTGIASHTAPGGTVATYTAAGHVRRGLADAGFAVSRVPGFGRKRHMTRAILAPKDPS